MKKFSLILKDIFRSKSSLLVIFSIILVIIIPIVLYFTSSSFIDTANKEANKMYGYFDNILYDTNDSDEKKYSDFIDSAGKIEVLQNVNSNNSDNIDFVIGYFDDTARELASIKLIEGEYPKNQNEIALCNSVIYKNNLSKNIGSIIKIQEKEYKLVGIINDYYALWNKPTDNNDILLPNALISYDSKSKYINILQTHFLLKNSNPFTAEIYSENEMLVSNVNRSEKNEGKKYNIPIFVIVLTTICSVLLTVYIFFYYFEKEKKKLSILRCLSLTKAETILYSFVKVIVMLFISLPFGILLGYSISAIIIKIFNKVLLLDNEVIFVPAYAIFSVIICLITLLVSFIIISIKIVKLTPLGIIKKDINGKNRLFLKEQNQTRRINLFKLAFLELKLHFKNSIIIILLLSFSLSLFVSLSVYMKSYASQKSDVQGRMSLNFDYEFLTDQYISDISYVNENGKVTNLNSIPNEDSVYYVMDHTKIISDEIVNEMKHESDIKTVNNYLEINDLYLLNSPSENDTPYLEGYFNDDILNDEMKNCFSINGNVRGIQYFGYSEDELLKMNSKVVEGEINIDKIRSGEEIVLMAPMYELKNLNGYTVQSFITSDEYNGKNQYIDTNYSVNDEIEIIQFLPKNNNLKGYINEEQAENELNCVRRKVKIGAIIYERIAWFDSLSQPPTAYTLIGLNDTIKHLALSPTVSRTQVFLKDTSSYEDFDSIIQYYKNELNGFSFRNNAAELQEFKEFKVIINILCYSLIGIISLIVISIILIEDKITIYRNKKFYALLHLNGLDDFSIEKILVIRSIYIGIISIICSILISLLVITIFFGGLFDTINYVNMAQLSLSIVFEFAVLIFSALISYNPLRKKQLVELLND